MESVLISIQPKWVKKIVNREKTIEVRKNKPNLATPFKCYIYCTQNKKGQDPLLIDTQKYADFGDYRNAFTCDVDGNVYCYIANGCVIGEFTCDEIFPIKVFENGTIQYYNYYDMEKSCVPYDDIVNYIFQAGEDNAVYFEDCVKIIIKSGLAIERERLMSLLAVTKDDTEKREILAKIGQIVQKEKSNK